MNDESEVQPSSRVSRIFSELLDLGLYVVFTELPQLSVQSRGHPIGAEVLYRLDMRRKICEGKVKHALVHGSLEMY